jgi:hypothetical protein
MPKYLVYQEVPKRHNVDPGYQGILLAEFTADPGRRFTHHGKPLRNCVAQRLVSKKLRLSSSCEDHRNPVQSFEDVV